MGMGLKARLAAVAGDIWRSWSMLALWPYPAVMLGHRRTMFTWDDYRAFTRRLRPGDIICATSEPYFLSNFGIRGTAFKHVAVYVGPVKGFRDQDSGFIMKPRPLHGHQHTGTPAHGIFERAVVHAISEGVVCQDLGEELFSADYVAAFRPWSTPDQQMSIIESAAAEVGAQYNFAFRPDGPEAFYCTELGAHCCCQAGIEPPAHVDVNTSLLGFVLPLKRFLSKVTVADTFVKYPMIVCSMSCNDPAFARKGRLARELRSAFLKAPDASRDMPGQPCQQCQ
jgi:hypothetical protein